jgi:20S proteasome subunit beta 5
MSLLTAALLAVSSVYHVAEDGWKKMVGDDVTELHFKYYQDPSSHPSAGTPVL